MKPAIRTSGDEREFLTAEGCWIRESWNSETDPAVSIARARVEPGVTTQLHRLRDVAERYVIVRGIGLVCVGTLEPQRVGPGDVVVIPPGTPQQITNDGDADLVFYCVCTPRFRPECYETIEG